MIDGDLDNKIGSTVAGPTSKDEWQQTSIEHLRACQAAFAHERQWQQYHTPRNLLCAMVGEVGELSELFQWCGDVQPGLQEFSEEKRKCVAEEMSDVLLYLIRMADVCGIDLGQAALEKILKNSRKYPVDKCKGSSAKYTTYTKAADDKI